MTFALASLVASASAAMDRCICWGSLTSLISTRSTWTPQGSVASSRLGEEKCRQEGEQKMQQNKKQDLVLAPNQKQELV